MDVLGLDLSVFVLTSLCFLHACIKRSDVILLFSGGILGLLVEQASLRFGGTHCHASGLIDVYIGLTAARNLCAGDTNHTMFPFIAGLVFVGICGPYEMQGPSMGWWLWPKEDYVVKEGCTITQFGDAGADPRGLVSVPHVQEALDERFYGVPFMALYFHYAFGWGIALAYQLANRHWGQKSQPWTQLVSVLVGPCFAMLWDPPIRLLKHFLGATKGTAVPVLLVFSTLLPFITGSGMPKAKPDKNPRGPLLFWAVVVWHAFFATNALTSPLIPGDLTLVVLGLACVCILLVQQAVQLSAQREVSVFLSFFSSAPASASGGSDSGSGSDSPAILPRGGPVRRSSRRRT